MGNELFFVVRTRDENGEITEKTAKFAELPCDADYVSDGFHTYGELYQHRDLLFCALSQMASLRREPPYCWKSRTHWIDGNLEPVWEGWFVAGIDLGGKMITYHLPLEYWDLLDGIIERDYAPLYDGHTSQDVIERLKEWLKAGRD